VIPKEAIFTNKGNFTKVPNMVSKRYKMKNKINLNKKQLKSKRCC